MDEETVVSHESDHVTNAICSRMRLRAHVQHQHTRGVNLAVERHHTNTTAKT